MPWTVQEGHEDCDDGQWAVVDSDDPTVLAPSGCHNDETDARDQAAALNEADAEDNDADAEAAGDVPWVGLLATEQDGPLGDADSRVFPAGTFQWGLSGRTLPFPMHALFTKSMGGHLDAEHAGRLDAIARVALPSAAVDELVGFKVTGDVAVVGRGVLRPQARAGQEAIDAVTSGSMTGVSLDPGADTEVASACLETDEDEWGEFCVRYEDRFLRYEVAGLTLVDTPGMPQARIRLADANTDAQWAALDDLGPGSGNSNGDTAAAAPALTAAGVLADRPPPSIELFTRPEPAKLTAWTVDLDAADLHDGWIPVYGHVAPAEGSGICHIGYPGECKEAPPSPTEYAAGFNLGAFPTDQGDVTVGRITMGCGHAPLRLGRRPVSAIEAQAHYDDNGYVGAYVHAVNGTHGWWVSGVVRPSLTDEQILDLKAGSLSGDWRPIGGALEGIRALVVNTPGFPIPRPESFAAAGETVGLVAAGIVRPCACHEQRTAGTDTDTDRRLAALERRQDRTDALMVDRHMDALATGILRHTPQDLALQALALRRRRTRR